ncbi:MAG: glycosyltransferase [Acidobacteriota bacterium]
MRLTAALIARDEERFLPGCLESLEDVVDEVVVVDTGSKDATPTIARQAGARVLHHAWRDDFAAARNVALDAARGDWILYIDADERVRGGRPDSLSKQLEDRSIVGLTVRFRPATGFTLYNEHRLFRRHPDIRFRGVIHETHLPDLYRLAGRDGLHIEHSELALDHLGYDGDISHKHPRNLPLLEARVRDDPDHVFSWWHLGQTLEGLGRSEDAATAWRQGLEASRRDGGGTGIMILPYLALLDRTAKLERRLDESLWREADERFPRHPRLLWLRALARIDDEEWAAAANDLEILVATDLEQPVAAQLATEERLFLTEAPLRLAHCLFRLERYAEASTLYRCLEDEQGMEEVTVWRRLAEIRARRHATETPAETGSAESSTHG